MHPHTKFEIPISKNIVDMHWTGSRTDGLTDARTNGGMEPRGRGGGTLICSHIRRLGPFFGVQNSEFQYFLGFSEK